MREWLWRLWATWRRDRDADARRDELQFHFDAEVEAAMARGLDAEQARREARRRVGSVWAGQVEFREGVGIGALDALGRDLRHAVRSLRHHGTFTTLTGTVLVFSVAVAVVLFALFDGVLLRPLPYRSPDRLVRLYDASPERPRFPMAIGRFIEYRRSASTLEGLALYTGRDVELSGDGRLSSRLTGVSVTSEFFAVLGWAPASGRAFTEADLRGNARTAILSDRLWRTAFSADPRIIGRTILLNRQPWTVIGVMPAGFQHVGGHYRSPPQGEAVDVWLPLGIPDDEGSLNGSHYCNAVGRLRDGRTLSEARQELAALADGYSRRDARFGTWTAHVTPLLGEVTGRSQSLVALLALAAALVLAVACANIAGLCVARALARQKDEAVRRALGASRWQRLRVALAENLLVGVAGAAAGVLLAAWTLPMFRAWLPLDFPRLHEIAFTPRAALFGVFVALATVLLATVFAAGSTRGLDSGHRLTTGRRVRRLRTTLVVVEIALAGVLCAGAIQLWRHYRVLTASDHGFATQGVLTFRVSIPIPTRPAPGEIGTRIESLRQSLLVIDGVRHVGATTNLPWSGYDENTSLRVVGRTLPGDMTSSVRYQAATEGYFDAMRMRVLSGRTFDATRDVRDRHLVVMINDATARRLFPAGDAIGARVSIFGEDREVVGVVRGIADQPTSGDVEPGMWFPLGQVEFVDVFFVVHVDAAAPMTRLDAVRAALQRVDPALPISDVQTMETRAAAALATQHLALRLFQVFAALTLLLAVSGLYGLLAYVVHQRRKELGIRSAVGANRIDLARLVLRDSLGMALAGAVACAAVLPAASAAWMTWTSGLGALDVWAWVGAPAVLLAIAILASLGPAHQASRHCDGAALRGD